MLGPIGVSGINHLIGYIFMMQLFSFNLVLIRLLELISFPKHSKNSCIIIKLKTLFSWKECVRPNWSFGVIHVFGHIFMMHMFSIILGFDSSYRAHFRPETFQRFIVFNQIEHFVLMERVC